MTTEGATSFDVTGGTIENTTDGLIAEAVAAERERCAAIVASWRDRVSTGRERALLSILAIEIM